MEVFPFIMILAVGILLPFPANCHEEEEDWGNYRLEVPGHPNIYYRYSNHKSRTYEILTKCPEGSAFIPTENICRCLPPNSVDKGTCVCPLDKAIDMTEDPCKCPGSSKSIVVNRTIRMCSCPKGKTSHASDPCICQDEPHFIDTTGKCRRCPDNTTQGDPSTCDCGDERKMFDHFMGTCKCKGDMVLDPKSGDCGCPTGSELEENSINMHTYICKCQAKNAKFLKRNETTGECVCKGNLVVDKLGHCGCPGTVTGKPEKFLPVPLCGCSDVVGAPAYNSDLGTCCSDPNKVPDSSSEDVLKPCVCDPITSFPNQAIPPVCECIPGFMKDPNTFGKCRNI